MIKTHAFGACLHPGCIVEFMQGDKPHLAWVLEEQAGKLRLLTETKREIKLPAARILSWTGPHHSGEHSREDMLRILAEHHERREQLGADIDPLEIWELAQGEVEKADVKWFAELLWDKTEAADTEHLAAAGRAMLGCKTHFKFQPPDFLVFTAEKVEARQHEKAAAEERDRFSNQGREFFERLWQTRNQVGGPELAQLSDDLEHRLRQLLLSRIANPEDQENDQVWKMVRKGLPEVPHLELQLAQAWGVVPPHHNYHYDQAGYAPGDAWSASFAGDIEAQERMLREAAQSAQIEPYEFVSVDSETTRDVDDAFHIESTAGGYVLRLALARPQLAWNLDSPLGRAVAQRATSVYLPEGDSHMLPEKLGTDLFSLSANDTRPAFVLELELRKDGTVLSCAPRCTWVRVACNESYARSEAAIAAHGQGREASFGAMLSLGVELAHALRRRRVENGAIVIERDDPELVLENQGPDLRVLLVTKPETPLSQLLVSELMILANSAVALWAREHGIPLLHRTQDIALPKESAGVWSAPEDVHRVVRSLSSAVLEPDPRPHSSLGVAAYSPVTSPLRRYPDFLNVFQLQHYLEHGEALFSREQLDSMLPLLNARLEAAGRIQRFRPRYWKLLYLKQQAKDTRYSAVVVDEGPHYLMLSLPNEQLFVRGPRDLFGDKAFPGQRFMVRLGKINPLHNQVHVLEAFEDEAVEPVEAAARS